LKTLWIGNQRAVDVVRVARRNGWLMTRSEYLRSLRVRPETLLRHGLARTGVDKTGGGR